jgi:hypothetical protein
MKRTRQSKEEYNRKKKIYAQRPEVIAMVKAKKNKPENIAKDREQQRIRWANNPNKKKIARNSALKRQYGITLIEYNQMFTDQNGNCSICNKNRSEFKTDLCVDHCHETNKVRGLLCHKCNLVIGNAFEDKKILSNAIEYLIKWNK